MIKTNTASYSNYERSDLIKPNFIFSSNISHKIYQNLINNNKENVSWSITINIQLNNLISRNKSVKLSDLEDLINIHSNQHYILRILKKENWEYKPLQEIFIVMVKLIILKFTESEIVFKQDESYQILNHCCFLDEIESYMKKIYHKYSHEDNDDTNLTSSSSNYYDISDSTLEYSSESEDNYTEFDGKHLESLKSNDTLIDEFKRKFNDISDEEKSFTKTHDFINNMSNLRHNDEDTVKSPTSQVANLPPPPEPQPHSQSQPEPEPIKEDYNPFRLDDLAEVDCEHEDDFDLQHIPDPSLPLPFSPAKRDFDEDDEIIKISKQPSFVSPTKNRRCMSLSQMTPSNFSMISDEKYGLEYAYNSDHSNVPSFIKDNKKFKFIKVGKVQKFVNLFEEHQQKEKDSAMNSRINSRKPSRMTSRSGSPGHN